MSTAAPFEYQVAGCWEEAIELLSMWGEDTKILAGGQSLAPMLNLRLAVPAGLIDINPIPTPEPRLDGDQLVLPALTRHQTLLRSPLVRRHCPLLPAAVAQVGNVRVRARGTVGGSLAHADPTGEIPCTVLALDGQIVAQGPHGQRVLDADGFFRACWTTALDEDEVVTEVRLPVRARGQGWDFREKVRRSSDFATVEVATTVQRSEDGDTITAATAVLGGVADRPILLDQHHLEPLVGSTGEDRALRDVAEAAAASISPESDLHASADYRRRLTEVLTRRAFARAAERGANVGGDR